jgi:hypothetical protein
MPGNSEPPQNSGNVRKELPEAVILAEDRFADGNRHNLLDAKGLWFTAIPPGSRFLLPL